jgi:hypothetical protein
MLYGGSVFGQALTPQFLATLPPVSFSCPFIYAGRKGYDEGLRRWLFNVMSGLSLLLFAAVIFICVRSHDSWARYSWQKADGKGIQCTVIAGSLGYQQGNIVFDQTDVVFTFRRPDYVPEAVDAARAVLPPSAWTSTRIVNSQTQTWRWMGAEFSFTKKPPITGGGRFPFGRSRPVPR